MELFLKFEASLIFAGWYKWRRRELLGELGVCFSTTFLFFLAVSSLNYCVEGILLMLLQWTQFTRRCFEHAEAGGKRRRQASNFASSSSSTRAAANQSAAKFEKAPLPSLCRCLGQLVFNQDAEPSNGFLVSLCPLKQTQKDRPNWASSKTRSR